MAATTKKSAQKPLLDDDQIISLYMNDVLENNAASQNIYSFCKKNGIEEAQFYTFFGSFDAVRKAIWVKFFENTLAIMHKDEGYQHYSDKNKLLTLYFTFFEILTLNRSYVMYSLKENRNGLKNLADLKHLRSHFKDFIMTIMTGATEEKNSKVSKVTTPVFSEGAWIQFLFILKFWIDDSSKGFEKTDIVIEKSVNTVVDLLNTKPLENLIDLGKFLWNERKA